MKSSRHGEHQPGMRRAGEGDPTLEEFDALKARVKALEDAGAGGGGKRYRLHAVGGVDASSGDADTGVPGLQGWTIVDAIRLNRTDPGGSPSDDGGWGSINDFFVNPIPKNVAITFKAGHDTSAYDFLLLVESP